MPIKPIYAEKIISGVKQFEFRKKRINSNISYIIVYASTPVKKIVGIVEVEDVLIGTPYSIWKVTKHAAGISRQNFREYYAGSILACAIRIKRVLPLRRLLSPGDICNKFIVPQSFSYVEYRFLHSVLRKGIV